MMHLETRNGVAQETNLYRGTEFRNVLRDRVFPMVPSDQPVRVLDVGSGFEAGSLLCPYEPYRIAGLFDAQGRDYKMAIADINAQVIEDVRRRRRIFRHNSRDSKIDREWNEYLQETQQAAQEIHTVEPGVVFQDWVKEESQKRILEQGLLIADIPVSFRRKLDTDEIAFVTCDIAVAELHATGCAPFHAVSATNVLIYLRSIGQQLALYNLSQALAPGGYLVVTDYQIIYPWMESLFKKQWHGWLTEEALAKDFDMTIADRIPVEERTTYVFRKN